MISRTIKRSITIALVVLIMALMAMPSFGLVFGSGQSAAYAAEDYFKTWGKDISEKDYERMSEKWPDYEPLRCNGWMTEVMKEVYDIPMSMGDWVIGTRTNFLNNSTVKPVKVTAGSYSEIKEKVTLIKPGDIVFFNSDKGGNGTWTHVALIGEDHMMWHCTATSPGSKTGKYKSITGWMKKYQNQGEYGAYAEVWRVLSSFSVKSKVKITWNNYPGKLRIAKYKKGKNITVRQTLTYKAYGPLVGKKIDIVASLNKNKVTRDNGNPVYTKSKKVTDGEKFKGSKNLRFTLKDSGKIKIYYRFTIDDKIKESTSMTVFTKIKHGSKVLKNYSEAGAPLRMIRFRKKGTR